MTTITPAYLQFLTQQPIIKYCRVAPMSIWMFEYLLTFDEEVRLMTNKKSWGVTHVLYLLTRYFPMIGSLCVVYDGMLIAQQNAACIALYRVAEISLFFSMLAAEGLLLIRTVALWNHRRAICFYLSMIYGTVGAAMFTCSVVMISRKFKDICAIRTESLTTAGDATLSFVTAGMFSSAACFELVVLTLTLLHAYTLRQSGSRRGKVVSAVTRGNVVYTLVIFLTSIASITFFVLPLEEGWNGLLTTFQGVLHGVVASRVLFDLQDALHHQEDINGACSMSLMQFAMGPLSRTTRSADLSPASNLASAPA